MCPSLPLALRLKRRFAEERFALRNSHMFVARECHTGRTLRGGDDLLPTIVYNSRPMLSCSPVKQSLPRALARSDPRSDPPLPEPSSHLSLPPLEAAADPSALQTAAASSHLFHAPQGGDDVHFHAPNGRRSSGFLNQAQVAGHSWPSPVAAPTAPPQALSLSSPATLSGLSHSPILCSLAPQDRHSSHVAITSAHPAHSTLSAHPTHSLSHHPSSYAGPGERRTQGTQKYGLGQPLDGGDFLASKSLQARFTYHGQNLRIKARHSVSATVLA